MEGTLLFLVSLREILRVWGPGPARAGPEILGIDSRGSSSTLSTTRAPTRLSRGRRSRGVARVAGSCQGSALRARLGLVIEVFLSTESLLSSSEIVLLMAGAASQGSNIGVSRGIETVARSWLSRGQIHRFWVNNVVDSTSVV